MPRTWRRGCAAVCLVLVLMTTPVSAQPGPQDGGSNWWGQALTWLGAILPMSFDSDLPGDDAEPRCAGRAAGSTGTGDTVEQEGVHRDGEAFPELDPNGQSVSSHGEAFPELDPNG